MSLPLYIHHTLIHAPIVLSPVLAIIGTYWLVDGSPALAKLTRFLGDVCAAIVVCAVAAGLSAEATSTALATYIDHRDLGITTALLSVVAAGSFEYGAKNAHPRFCQFGALMWWIVTLSAIGAAHWGAKLTHSGLMPF